MFKKSLFVGVTAGILSGVASIVFEIVYKETMFVDFTPVVKYSNLLGACVFGCVLASIGYWAIMKVSPKYGEIIFNFLFTIISFATIIMPLKYMSNMFPPELDIAGIDDMTSYFQPFAMTLHFFPALIWFAVKPIFIK
jgi:hypothetical protein